MKWKKKNERQRRESWLIRITGKRRENASGGSGPHLHNQSAGHSIAHTCYTRIKISNRRQLRACMAIVWLQDSSRIPPGFLQDSWDSLRDSPVSWQGNGFGCFDMNLRDETMGWKHVEFLRWNVNLCVHKLRRDSRWRQGQRPRFFDLEVSGSGGIGGRFKFSTGAAPLRKEAQRQALIKHRKKEKKEKCGHSLRISSRLFFPSFPFLSFFLSFFLILFSIAFSRLGRRCVFVWLIGIIFRLHLSFLWFRPSSSSFFSVCFFFFFFPPMGWDAGMRGCSGGMLGFGNFGCSNLKRLIHRPEPPVLAFMQIHFVSFLFKWLSFVERLDVFICITISRNPRLPFCIPSEGRWSPNDSQTPNCSWNTSERCSKMLEDALGSDRKLWTLQDALAFLRIL